MPLNNNLLQQQLQQGSDYYRGLGEIENPQERMQQRYNVQPGEAQQLFTAQQQPRQYSQNSILAAIQRMFGGGQQQPQQPQPQQQGGQLLR